VPRSRCAAGVCWSLASGLAGRSPRLAAVSEGLGCGFIGPDIAGLRGYLGIPDAFVPIGVMPMGRPLQDIRSPSLKRGWVPFDEFARWQAWEA
jgi:nitroreductase